MKLKNFIKKYLIGIIAGLILVTFVGVSAATYFPSSSTTYDNSATGMNATNVQTAIDELYKVCATSPITSNQIIENNNLEKDPYECRYFFTGDNPKNYVSINSASSTPDWRIMSVECDGRIKLIHLGSVASRKYDENSFNITDISNAWNEAALNTYLNNTYYKTLSESLKNYIISSEFSIGSVKNDNNDISQQVSDENSLKWNGKIGLITLSEYIRSNSNKTNCKTFQLFSDNWINCVRTGWMDNYNTSGPEEWWTLTPYSGYTNLVYTISRGESTRRGYIDYSDAGYTKYTVIPVIYISSAVQFTGGTGTYSNPYTLS